MTVDGVGGLSIVAYEVGLNFALVVVKKYKYTGKYPVIIPLRCSIFTRIAYCFRYSLLSLVEPTSFINGVDVLLLETILLVYINVLFNVHY